MQPPNRPGIPGADTEGFHGDHRGEGVSDEERIRQAGKEGVAAARQQAESKLEQGRQSAVETADGASRALDETAARLSAEGQESLAEAASALSHRLSGLAGYLETHSIDELASEARRIARNNPALFIAGGVAVGLTLGRFFKASASRVHDEAGGELGDPLDPRRHEASPGLHAPPPTTAAPSGSATPTTPRDLPGGRYE